MRGQSVSKFAGELVGREQNAEEEKKEEKQMIYYLINQFRFVALRICCCLK